AGVGRRGEQVLALGIVQRVIEARDRARGVAEGGVRCDIVDALAVDVDFAPVAQAGEVFRAGERPPARADGVLGLDAAHGTAPRTRDTGSKALADAGVNARVSRSAGPGSGRSGRERGDATSHSAIAAKTTAKPDGESAAQGRSPRQN